MKSKYSERRWLKASEITKVYGLPRRLVENLYQNGKLKTCEINGRRMFRVQEIEQLLKQ